MSVYTTVTLSREEAISRIREEDAKRKSYHEMSNYELEEKLFEYFGNEDLPHSRLENYIVN